MIKINEEGRWTNNASFHFLLNLDRKNPPLQKKGAL